MGDYGAAVSQKGYDVKTCADRFLVYSSAFQTLKIYNTYTVSTTKPSAGGAHNIITITHNLGYYAPFFVVFNGSTTIGTLKSYFFSDSTGFRKMHDYVRNYQNYMEIEVDDYFDDEGTAAGATVYFTVYLFLDDFRTVAESSINSGASSGASSTDYGFRISKVGFDVKSCVDKDCVITSSQFSQIVHKKGSSTSSGTTMSISHSLGYIPAAFPYIRPSGTSYIKLCYTSSFLTGSIDLYDIASGDVVYYIIFKNKLT